MEEQEIGGKQILESVGLLKDITLSVKKGTSDMSSSGEELIKKTHEFISISNQVVDGMNKIVSGAMTEIQSAVKNVGEMNSLNNNNFTDLKRETEKFKVTSGAEVKKILVVDDDETHLIATKRMLEDKYETVTVKSGFEAISLFHNGYVPNIILLDLIMPGMDGWSAYERIKGISSLHNVKIAIFSSSDDPQHKAKGRELGAVDYITKPVKKTDLLGRIENLIGA
jgi:CheY-like chemotaxis protein